MKQDSVAITGASQGIGRSTRKTLSGRAPR